MSALDIGTDLYRTLFTATARKENKILNGRSRRESSVHLIIMIVCKMKMFLKR